MNTLANIRRAIAAVGAGALLGLWAGVTPAYAADVDLHAIAATASGTAGQSVLLPIGYEASADISSTQGARLDITPPLGVELSWSFSSPACQHFGTTTIRCTIAHVQSGSHELPFRLVVPDVKSATGSFRLTLTASGYVDPKPANNIASITVKRTSGSSPSPSPSATPSAASPTSSPKPVKRSSSPSAEPEATDAAPATEEPSSEPTVTDPASAAIDASTSDDGGSNLLPVVILGGAGLLVAVGGALLWMVFRRSSDEDDEDDEDDGYDNLFTQRLPRIG